MVHYQGILDKVMNYKHDYECYAMVIDSIEKICEVPVNVEVNIYKNRILLWIKSSVIDHWCLDCGEETHTEVLFHENIINKEIELADILMCFIKINKIIKTFKFDKVYGRFTRFGIPHKITHFNIFKDNKNISTSADKCAVCLEYTKTETGCGHKICIVCFGELLNKKMPCPICRRKKINYNRGGCDRCNDEESECEEEE